MAKFQISDATQGPWVLDLDTLMTSEAVELRKLTGFGAFEWLDALSEDDAIALRYAFYLARKRAGEEIKFADVDVNIFTRKLLKLGDDGEPVAPDDQIPDEVADVVPTGPGTSDEAPTPN